MATLPTVDVVMPLYNKGPFVEKAIRSALNQSGADVTICVADDASTDGGFDVARNLSFEDPRVLTLPSPFDRPTGVGAARNRALHAGTSQYVAFLDADDWWEPGYLESQLEHLKDNVGLVHCESNVVDGTSERHKYIMRNGTMPSEDNQYNDVRLEVYRIGCPSAVVVPRDIFDVVGDFNSTLLNLGDDWEMWARISRLSKIAQNNRVLCNIRDLATPSKTLHGIERFVQWSRVFDRWKDDTEFLPKAVWIARKRLRQTLAEAYFNPRMLLETIPKRLKDDGGIVGRMMFPNRTSYLAAVANIPVWLAGRSVKRVFGR